MNPYVQVKFPKSPWGRQGSKGNGHLPSPTDPWVSLCGLPVVGASKKNKMQCSGCWILSGRAAGYFEARRQWRQARNQARST